LAAELNYEFILSAPLVLCLINSCLIIKFKGWSKILFQITLLLSKFPKVCFIWYLDTHDVKKFATKNYKNSSFIDYSFIHSAFHVSSLFLAFSSLSSYYYSSVYNVRCNVTCIYSMILIWTLIILIVIRKYVFCFFLFYVHIKNENLRLIRVYNF